MNFFGLKCISSLFPSNFLQKNNFSIDHEKIFDSNQKKIKEDFLDKHTFSPKTNVDKNHEILDFSLFLDNQNKFTHKVTKKVSQLKQEIEKKKAMYCPGCNKKNYYKRSPLIFLNFLS